MFISTVRPATVQSRFASQEKIDQALIKTVLEPMLEQVKNGKVRKLGHMAEFLGNQHDKQFLMEFNLNGKPLTFQVHPYDHLGIPDQTDMLNYDLNVQAFEWLNASAVQGYITKDDMRSKSFTPIKWRLAITSTNSSFSFDNYKKNQHYRSTTPNVVKMGKEIFEALKNGTTFQSSGDDPVDISL